MLQAILQICRVGQDATLRGLFYIEMRIIVNMLASLDTCLLPFPCPAALRPRKRGSLITAG